MKDNFKDDHNNSILCGINMAPKERERDSTTLIHVGSISAICIDQPHVLTT